MNGTVVHRPVTVDSGVPSSCQISSLLNLLENHIDLEMNFLLTPTWIPCGVEKGLLYSLSPCSTLSNKLNKLLPFPYCSSLYQEGRRLANSSCKQLSCRGAEVTVLVEEAEIPGVECHDNSVHSVC